MVKQERARRTREKVLDAAAEEFVVQGYRNTTLNAVAERTGMTKGALYGHFSAKEKLASALLDHSRKVWGEVRPSGDVLEAGALPALESLVLRLTPRLRNDMRLRAALRLAADCPDLVSPLSDVFAQVRGDLGELVSRAQREGGLGAYPTEAVVRLLMEVLRGALQACCRPGVCDELLAWEEVWRLVLAALSYGTAVSGGVNDWPKKQIEEGKIYPLEGIFLGASERLAAAGGPRPPRRRQRTSQAT